jgi:hypothetical protein
MDYIAMVIVIKIAQSNSDYWGLLTGVPHLGGDGAEERRRRAHGNAMEVHS